MSDFVTGRSSDGPLADLDDWESAHEPDEAANRRLPRLPRERPARRRRVLPAEPRAPDARLRPGEEAASTCAKTRRRMGIWEAMEFLNTLVDDSDPDTDLSQIEHLMQTAEAIRGRRPPAVVHPHRPDPRPRQDPLPLRRAAVGGGRRHLPGRLPLLRQDRLPRVLRRQPRQPGPRVSDPRAASTRSTAGWTTSTSRGATTSTSTTSSRTTSPTRAWR